MKVITCLAAAATISALAAGAHAAEPQRGIKMLITAATHHHQSGSVPAHGSPAPGGETGIDKLIAAATASRHLPPVGVGPHAFRDAASEGEAKNPVDIVTPHPGAGADPIIGPNGRSVHLPPPGPVIGMRTTDRLTGLGATTLQAPVHGPGSVLMPNGAAAEGSHRLQHFSPVFVHPPGQGWGGINGTAAGRPNLAVIGAAGTTGHPAAGISGTSGHPAAGISGTAFRPKH